MFEMRNLSESMKHFIELPILKGNFSSEYLYPTNTDIALIIPLFGEDPKDYIHHLHAKASVYCALSFLKRTDIKECRIPIFFSIGDTRIEDISVYLDHAHIPDENRIQFEQKSDNRCFCKYAGAFTPELSKFKRYLIVDSDIWVHAPKGKCLPFFHSVLEKWEYPCIFQTRHENDAPVLYDSDIIGREKTLKTLSKRFPEIDKITKYLITSDSGPFAKIHNAIHGVSYESLKILFKEFLPKTLDIIHCDEALFSVYLYYYPDFNQFSCNFIEEYPSIDEKVIVHKPPSYRGYEMWKDRFFTQMEELTQ